MSETIDYYFSPVSKLESAGQQNQSKSKDKKLETKEFKKDQSTAALRIQSNQILKLDKFSQQIRENLERQRSNSKRIQLYKNLIKQSSKISQFDPYQRKSLENNKGNLVINLQQNGRKKQLKITGLSTTILNEIINSLDMIMQQ